MPSRLFVAYEDGKLSVQNVSAEADILLDTTITHPPLRSLAFQAPYLFVASVQGDIARYNTDITTLLNQACAYTADNLSAETWLDMAEKLGQSTGIEDYPLLCPQYPLPPSVIEHWLKVDGLEASTSDITRISRCQLGTSPC